jgi:hypothetical protein
MVSGNVPYRHGSLVTFALCAVAICLLHVRPRRSFGVEGLGTGICLWMGPCMSISSLLPLFESLANCETPFFFSHHPSPAYYFSYSSDANSGL